MKRKLLGLFSISILTILGICALEKTTNAVIGSGNGYMLTLTQTNGGVTNSSGYNSGNTSAKTVLGNTVSFAYENCIKSTGENYKSYFAQMRASTGTFYNTSAILGITDITVNFKSNASLSLYTSFTSNDTSGDVTTLTNQGVSTLATVKKTFTNNPTYFTLKAGSAVAYIESILVNYTCLENNDPSSEDPSSETPSSSEEEITVRSVSIVGNLSKTSYVEGDSWDLSGLSLQVNYSNNTNENLGALTNIDDLEYELSPSIPTIGNTSLRIFNIKYQGTSFASAERTITGITVASSGSSEPENNKTIRFELGANGTSSHQDGNSATSYTETVDGYKLSLTNGSNMYTGAIDAKGNGAIKLGSSSKTGGFNFTVPSDVNSVNLEVGKYKANASIITLNGQQHTLTKSSNDGAYDVFTVDTSSNKNISLTTVSGSSRAMVNAIEYVVGGQGNITPEPETPTFVGIQINGDMTQKTYNEGDSWNLAGLSLYGVYSDESTAKIGDITKLIGNDLFDYEVNPSNATKGTTSITLYVLYQQDDEIYETKKPITSIVVNSIEEPSEPSSTVNATLTFDNKSKRTEYSSTIQVWKENGVTFTNNKNSSAGDVADYAAPVRLYAGSDMIVEVDGQISEISFDCYSTSYANALKNSISGSSVSNDKVTVTNLSTDKFIVESLTAQVRLDALTVTYTSTGSGNTGGNTPGGDVGDDDTPTTNTGSFYSPTSYSYRSGMENYNNLEEYGYYDCDSAPSTGNINVLVVPIAFSDSTANTNQVINDLDTVFNGTEEETGWESVSSFFKESSYGELNLSFTVAPTWYPYNKTASYMSVDNVGRTNVAVDSAVDWYKQTYNTSCKEFDSDSNGYIDCVFLVYAEKDYQIAGSSPNNFWAYTYWTQKDNRNRTSPNANTYIWMSYDFMYGNMNGSEHIHLDAHTFIHEYGHAMGLDDYYDYGGNECSAGGFDMQDMNVGDHNPFSKMALGWSKPYIVNGDATITIKPASKNANQAILIPAGGYSSWNKSPFDEYILIEYFTAEGLNKFDVEHQTYNGYPRGTSTPGLRVYHIDARLCYRNGSGYADSVSSSYYYEVAASNTSSGEHQSAYAPNYRLAHLLSQSGTDYMKKGSYMDEYDLFLKGDSFSMSAFKSYFYNSGKLNDGSNLGFTFVVKNITSESATIEFKVA